VLASLELALLLAAVPEFRVAPPLPPALAAEAAAAWGRVELASGAAGLGPVSAPRGVHIAAAALPQGQAGSGVPGRVELRGGLRGDPLLAAIRHEVAHQFLWQACPPASGDRLFHEVFAMALSGEVASWEEGQYLPVPRAQATLASAHSLDAPSVRRALARLLAEEPGPLPRALVRRVPLCEAGARWAPLGADELGNNPTGGGAGDALVVLSRHSGEVLAAEGAARRPMPFGSVLKPFVVAGHAGRPPRLSPDRRRDDWACGVGAGPVGWEEALLHSCNGYFLDWAARDPGAAGYGAFESVLGALGLARQPSGAAEAIGLRPALMLAPLAVAEAWRLLAESHPHLLAVLGRNADEGTLSGLPDSRRLRGVAAKTGTLRDAVGDPMLGWIAAVDRDLVVVRVRAGRAPRSFAGEVADALARWRPAQHATQVQVLGLVPAERILARCPGAGFAAGPEGPVPAPGGFSPLAALARRGRAVCLGGPWQVRFPGLEAPRAYAGVFTWSPAPPYAPPPGEPVSERARRARRGSDLVFRTSCLRYVSGVIGAEDASLTGPIRAALARIAAHNAVTPRHTARPLCDTTHCQAFQGTAPPRAEEREALREPPLPGGWLPFSRGGDEPWRQRRPAAAVERLLGASARALAFSAGRARFLETVTAGDAPHEEAREIPCERLRSPLRLPACPERAFADGGDVVFEGRGAGHGEGLDLERAKRSGLSAAALLREAYGF
jgi:hypothetical protein